MLELCFQYTEQKSASILLSLTSTGLQWSTEENTGVYQANTGIFMIFNAEKKRRKKKEKSL